jgi:tRNA pseudouridine55 synthase
VLPEREAIEDALQAFRGTFLQQPPAFSAKKIDGKRSHKLARARANALSMPSPFDEALPALASVTVHRLEFVSAESDTVMLSLDCSAGFYVRSLAHDLGQRLGIGAHLSALRRTAAGTLTLDDAIPLEFAERSRDDAMDALLPLEAMLPHFAELILTDEGLLRALHGRNISVAEVASGSPVAMAPMRLLDQRGQLVGIGEPTDVRGVLHPSVVLR